MAICTDATIGSANDRITVVGNLQVEGLREIESEVVGIIRHPLAVDIGASFTKSGAIIVQYGTMVPVDVVTQDCHQVPHLIVRYSQRRQFLW